MSKILEMMQLGWNESKNYELIYGTELVCVSHIHHIFYMCCCIHPWRMFSFSEFMFYTDLSGISSSILCNIACDVVQVMAAIRIQNFQVQDILDLY